MGGIFLRKKAPAATYPQVGGYQRSWYQKKTESPRGGASRYAGGHGGLQAPRQGVWEAGSPPGRAGGLRGGRPPVKTILWTQNHLPTTFNHLPTTFNHLQNQDFRTRIWYFLFKKYENWSEWVHMARYELILKLVGALWVRIILKPLLTPKRTME